MVRVAALALMVTGGGCSDETLNPPAPPAGGALFTSYVAFGNSITAGYQSGGINDSTQQQGYPVLLAQQMGTAFVLPTLNNPGCPPPLLNIFTQTPVGVALNGCELRRTPVPPVINDVAVPGAKVVDALTNLNPNGGENPLTTFILGGRTQIQAAEAAHPTFVSVWLGNNDVLGAALAGDTTFLTDTATFAAELHATLDSIKAIPTLQGAVLIGVANVVEIPNLTSGLAYFGAKAAGALPPSMSVSGNCGPSPGAVGDSTLVPFAYGFGVLLAKAQAGQPANLNCAGDAAVLSKAELKAVVRNALAFNALIASEATARGWAYYDPNPLLDSIRVAGEVAVFPNAPPSPLAQEQPFGKWFSRDGVHPNAAAHKLIANHIIDAINATYKTSLAHVP
jgi:lysophospholipase L1-like esterase